MSLFGSLMGDVEDDPFFGSHMRHMNTMMNSLFSDPFGMLGGGGPLAIAGPRHGSSMVPFMPQMPSINRLFSANMDHGHMSAGSSFTSSTVVMSSGPNGKPQVYSSSSSTKIGPNGIKETRKTLQDSRTGTKKMSIGHHIGERAHLIEREQNVYSGDAEERQEFINIDEEEAEDFDREFHTKVGAPSRGPRLALPAPPAHAAHAPLAIAAPPPHAPNTSSEGRPRRHSNYRPAARRPLRATASPLVIPASTRVREVYSAPHPQRHRHRHHKPRHDAHTHHTHPHSQQQPHQQHSPGH